MEYLDEFTDYQCRLLDIFSDIRCFAEDDDEEVFAFYLRTRYDFETLKILTLLGISLRCNKTPQWQDRFKTNKDMFDTMYSYKKARYERKNQSPVDGLVRIFLDDFGGRIDEFAEVITDGLYAMTGTVKERDF